MPTDLISKKTRQLVREYFVGTSLAVISDEFDAADIAADLEFEPKAQSERRGSVEQHYHSLDFSRVDDVRKFLHLAENVLHTLEQTVETFDIGAPYAQGKRATLLKSLQRDGVEYRDGRLLLPASPETGLDDVAGHIDLPELQRQTQRMRDNVDSDPGLAIGTAKELIETTCKTILGDRGVEFSKDATIPDLVKLARKELELLPADIPESAKGADMIRRLLSNLGTVGQGVAELRGLYGTGHGKDGRHRGVPPRVARLAVGAAATLSTFLLETHEERGGR